MSGSGLSREASRRMSLGRTVKSRGPGLPTLRSSRSMMRKRVSPVMGANKPGPQGDREAAVKTSARGRPGRPAGPVVPAACIFFCRRATGLSRGPVFPAPSHCRGRCRQHHLGADGVAGVRWAVRKNRGVDVVAGTGADASQTPALPVRMRWRDAGTTAENEAGACPCHQAWRALDNYFLIFTPLVVNRCGRGSARTGRRVTAALPVPGG